ncbi:MAG: hypothetical protein ACR2ID_11155 [Chthoniobacterales bacterium]
MSYVLSSRDNVRTMDDVEHAAFRVKPAFSKDLREALNPSRRRREERTRRERRS